MSTTSGPTVPGRIGKSQLLLPTVSVPVLFLVLASMVEPSIGRERCAWKHHGRAGVTPGRALEVPAALWVSHPSVRCKTAPPPAGVDIGAVLSLCSINETFMLRSGRAGEPGSRPARARRERQRLAAKSCARSGRPAAAAPPHRAWGRAPPPKVA